MLLAGQERLGDSMTLWAGTKDVFQNINNSLAAIIGLMILQRKNDINDNSLSSQ